MSATENAKPPTVPDRQRLDKWLWHCRLQPTRSKAAIFIKDGFARINGQRISDPAKTVRIGDILTLALPNRTMVLRIRALLPRRVGPGLAGAAWEGLE